ncbi:uncharacterized protein C9orf152 homolog [Perognathus longimembris pacificus]|uniref:uncharacterized protein C9orf152 homolog n=1 Tax=Perognathus longimembris pacificus TaxID=214514 RepID=UPI002018F0FA|nr:uncharacterized protein C9orf152 homolog [Perognathus longimembris pacificus]
MKGLACPCPGLPHFWQLRAPFMAESSATQAPGQGPSVSIQFLRAQYEGLRRQQRTQAHLMVLPKGGSSSPAESMISAVWINKERSSLPPEDTEPGLDGMPEETDGSCLQAPESLWHTHLEMHRVVQTSHQETNHQLMPNNQLVAAIQSLPSEGDPHSCENHQKAQPEAAQCQGHVVSTQTKAMESNVKASIQCPPFTTNPHRPGKPAHYPFPQRKTPRISQAARNLGLYGPA